VSHAAKTPVRGVNAAAYDPEPAVSQNQPLKVDRLQKSERSARLADVGTQVQVRDDNRIKVFSLHAPYL
jgi:hypothetical protein